EAKKKGEKAQTATAVADEKPKENIGEKKGEELPPPLEEFEMRLYMHCKACVTKVKKIVMCFDGVEDVIADPIAQKVVVKGKKAAVGPMKVVECLQKKMRRKVELVLPIPPPVEKKEEPEPPKPEEKNEPPMIVVVLKVDIHCNVCAYGIRKRILKMKGVQSAEPNLEASEVTVKGVFKEAKLAKYVYKCTGKHVAIIKSELLTPPVSNDSDDKAKEEKGAEGNEEKEKKDGGDTGGKENDADAIAADNQYMYYPRLAFPSGYYSPLPMPPPGYVYQPAYPPLLYAAYVRHYQTLAPQIFSDENPNACSII
ncbi:hypothetical protein BAE44_0007498, partial [Dichanthelium oligosanthes]